MGWSGMGVSDLLCYSTPTLPDWDYSTTQILTLLSNTLQAGFWKCTLERVKEIWKLRPALCLEGLHLNPCPRGSFCVCVWVYACTEYVNY